MLKWKESGNRAAISERMNKTKIALFGYSEKWSAGLAKHAVPLQPLRYGAAPLNSNLGNARQTELVYQASRSLTLEVSNAVQTARSTAALYLEKCRANLRPLLGERWSLQAWNATGFTKGNLQVPKTNTDEVKEMLIAMQKYLQDHPAHQNATAGVTAQAAGALLTPLKADITALDTAESAQRQKRDSRDEAHKALSAYLRNSRKEIESVLAPTDARWMDFVDSVPGDLRAPEAVATLLVEAGRPGHVRLSFLGAVRADAYGVYVSTDGGATYPHFTTIHDTVADLVLTPGATVKIRVKASKAAGQSAFSPVAEVTVPIEAAA